MHRTLVLLAILASLLLPARGAAQAAADSATIRPGDAIRLAVWRQPDISGEFLVGPEGTIQHPLLSEVVVTGVPRAVVRDRLRQALSRYEREPNFVFTVLYRVGVGGEVRLPNLYAMTPETTIAQAVATAGGGTERARLDQVHVLRDGRDIVVDLRRPESDAAAMRVRSGDQIRVARRTDTFREVIAPAAGIIAAAAGIIAAVRN